MSRWQKLLLGTISVAITFLIAYLIIDACIFKEFFLKDVFTSLEPGWHTTIYPFGTPLQLTVAVLIFAFIVCLVFNYSQKILKVIWTKLFR